MTLVKKLLLGGVSTAAVGGAGVGGVMLVRKFSAEENKSLGGGSGVDENREKQNTVVSGIVVGQDAAKTDEPKDQIRLAGLNCGDATKETNCSIGSTGLNVDRDGKKEGLFPSGTDNGNIKFRLSEDTTTYKNKYRFTITEKPIKLQSKTNPSDTITLERYENYGLEKEDTTNKVYLTRKLTAEQGKIKVLGLPSNITLPATVNTTGNSYELSTEQIKLVNFDGKQAGGATTGDKVNLKIYKVNDTTTFGGGYRFSFQPHQDITIAPENKLPKDVWWDFKLKDPNADELSLEKVWKSDTELLKEVGLSCNGNSTCTINDGSLKLKVENSSIEKGKKKEGSGTIYLEKNKPGYYEGLRFSVWGGEITIENSASPSGSPIKMKETEIYHISKEDKNGSSYYLTLKHDVKEMILYNLGLSSNGCSLPESGSNTCTVQSKNLGNIKFHDGTGEQKITGNNSNLTVTITIATGQDSATYPFGYKFSIKTESGTIASGSISLTTSTTDFKIKKDSANKKLFLEKV